MSVSAESPTQRYALWIDAELGCYEKESLGVGLARHGAFAEFVIHESRHEVIHDRFYAAIELVGEHGKLFSAPLKLQECLHHAVVNRRMRLSVLVVSLFPASEDALDLVWGRSCGTA